MKKIKIEMERLLMKKELTIEGMKCEGCASTVVEKNQAVEGRRSICHLYRTY